MADCTGTLLTISVAARVVNRSATTLRLWERRGLLSPVRDSSGRRLYRQQDVLKAAATIRRPFNDPLTGRFRMLEPDASRRKRGA